MKIYLFTMVKDEVDIIDDWIRYHGSIFGYKNLFVIDNYSTDGTYERLLEYVNKNKINLYRKSNYKHKGKYIEKLIRHYCNKYDFAYPLDIDEFIVLYQNGQINVSQKEIIDYFNHLPRHKLYKTNYIISKITRDLDLKYVDNNQSVVYGYDRASIESKYGLYADYKGFAKSFFKPYRFKGNLDHGNHLHSKKYYLTNLCLVHFHQRNLDQMKKKILNNVLGLGYINDIDKLQEQISKKSNFGIHHIENQIKVLNNTYKISIDEMPQELDIISNPNLYIDLSPLTTYINTLI